MVGITAADVGAAAIAWLAGLGWQVAHGQDVGPMRRELEEQTNIVYSRL